MGLIFDYLMSEIVLISWPLSLKDIVSVSEFWFIQMWLEWRLSQDPVLWSQWNVFLCFSEWN